MISRKTKILIAVASLGYFVDAFDLILFGVVRVPSLKTLGLNEASILSEGQLLFNFQLIGMLIGGIFWGILGDKKGRLSVLFGSIIIYSVANLLNSFVTDLTTYAILRFIAGIGLAGELGVGVTIVSECLPKEKRGYGSTIIASFGAMGALSAPLIYKFLLSQNLQFEAWRAAYFVGGVLGFLLLFLRLGVIESSLFDKINHIKNKGNFLALITKPSQVKRYLLCIFLGLPIWYIISILALIAPEMAAALKVNGKVETADVIFYFYLGLAIGDMACGLISQLLKSRKNTIYLYLIASIVMVWVYLHANGVGNDTFYVIYFLLGIVAGFWALFLMISAEQFGTNIRATVATSVPNLVRGAVILINMAFLAIAKSVGIIQSALIIGSICFSLAFIANYFLKETFGADLDFVEE
jgi:MFS transporter, putative metabolite:H+ symporter